jgi:hypothetical protein
MRSYEIRIADMVTRFIASKEPSMGVSFSPGENPPDAYIHLVEEILPLEITTTEVQRDPAFGDMTVREITYEESHRRLLQEIEKEAIEDKKLNGKYAISFSKPLASEQFSTYKAIFKSMLLRLIEDSIESPAGFQEALYHDYLKLAWVYKLSDKGKKLYGIFEDGALTESPEFIELVRSIIRKVIKTKIEKISRVVDPSRCILAIVNSYGLADDQAIRMACDDLVEVSVFHTVLIFNSNRLLVIHSANPAWK